MAGCLSACGGAGEGSAASPNIVLITIDTLRPDHLTHMGYERDTAPFLARLASAGAVFENAFSTSSWTAPSTASILTGMYPAHHGVTRGFFAHFGKGDNASTESEMTLPRIPGDVATLAETFRKNGYRTFGVASNINIGPEMGLDRGFEKFERDDGWPKRTDGWPARPMRERLLEWRAEIQAGEPYFLYLHFNDPHHPYHRRKRWHYEAEGEVDQKRALYDSEIGYLDNVLEKLYADFNLEQNTIIAVVSDHGEEFKEHGRWYHGFSLHGELNRVVFMLHAPQAGVTPGRHSENVSLIDMAPTLVELAGLASDQAFDGLSLVPVLRGSDALRPQLLGRSLYSHRFKGDSHMWAVMREQWKLIVDSDGNTELYDMQNDRGEFQNLVEQHAELATRLQSEIDSYKALGERTDADSTSVELSDKLLERLKALGYIKDD